MPMTNSLMRVAKWDGNAPKRLRSHRTFPWGLHIMLHSLLFGIRHTGIDKETAKAAYRMNIETSGLAMPNWCISTRMRERSEGEN